MNIKLGGTTTDCPFQASSGSVRRFIQFWQWQFLGQWQLLSRQWQIYKVCVADRVFLLKFVFFKFSQVCRVVDRGEADRGGGGSWTSPDPPDCCGFRINVYDHLNLEVLESEIFGDIGEWNIGINFVCRYCLHIQEMKQKDILFMRKW